MYFAPPQKRLSTKLLDFFPHQILITLKVLNQKLLDLFQPNATPTFYIFSSRAPLNPRLSHGIPENEKKNKNKSPLFCKDAGGTPNCPVGSRFRMLKTAILQNA